MQSMVDVSPVVFDAAISLRNNSSRWRRYHHDAMTYDTLGETEGDQRWCDHCGLAVEPVGDDEPTCPACGRAVD